MDYQSIKFLYVFLMLFLKLKVNSQYLNLSYF